MTSRLLVPVALASLLAGCGSFERLATVGREPPITPIGVPVTRASYVPISMPMPEPDAATYNSNSLWRSGARAFFKDQRAMRVGDILTVVVKIEDKAEIDNATRRTRQGAEEFGFNGFFGADKKLATALPAGVDFSKIVDLESGAKSGGSGTIDREETVTTKIAAVVSQRLPNGNLVIEGRQEVRVNYEKREMIVAGVVRPEDITSDNTIPFSKIAEARVSYGGRGQLTDVQQPRYGQQVLDVLLPF